MNNSLQNYEKKEIVQRRDFLRSQLELIKMRSAGNANPAERMNLPNINLI